MFCFLNPQLWLNECNSSAIPFSLLSMLINERMTQRETEFSATLQHWIGGKEDNKNVNVDFFGVRIGVVEDCSLIQKNVLEGCGRYI